MGDRGAQALSAAPPVPEGAPRELTRVLSLPDLVLGQVLVVVGTNWLGTAARLGPAHHVYWLLGILCFHLPLAAVVIRLSRERPQEGGIYQWARAAFGETAGFQVGWNIWLFIVAFTGTLGLATSQGLGYGARALGFADVAVSPALLHLALMALLVTLSVAGLGTGRWLHGAGAVLLLLLLVALVALAATAPRAAGSPGAEVALPSGLLALELFTKMSVFGLAGLECLATLSGEARDPRRDLPRSVALAVPMIALFYIAGSDALLALVPPAAVDLVNPVAQAFAARSGSLAAAAAIAALLVRDLAQASLSFSAITRLPMVAGWDRLLPSWFARLDAARRLPTRSIVFAGAVAWGLGFLGGLGVGAAEAYQLLQSAAGLFFTSAYVALFAIPLLARPGFSRPPAWLRLAAASGLAVTLLFMLLSVVPVVAVESALAFGAKVTGVYVAAQLLGLLLLRAGRRAAAVAAGAAH